MKYNFNLNQYAVITHKLDLDVIDLCVFDAFKDLANSAGCIKRIDDGRVYFWINYKIVIENAPMLGLNNKDSVYRRMKKLEAAGVIMFHNENQKIKKTFFTWGRSYDLLVFSKDGQESKSTDNHPYSVRTTIRTEYGQPSVLSTDNHPYNNNTNDNSTTDNNNPLNENEKVLIIPKKTEEQKAPPTPARPPVDPLINAIELSMRWAQENAATVKFWFDTYKIEGWTPEKLKQEIGVFFSHYQTEYQSDLHTCRKDPAKYFASGFYKWLSRHNKQVDTQLQQRPNYAPKKTAINTAKPIDRTQPQDF